MTLHRSLAHPIMRRSGERPQVIESPVPSSPLLRSAVLALGLAGAGPATAEITVAVARITEGALWLRAGRPARGRCHARRRLHREGRPARLFPLPRRASPLQLH